MTSTRSRVAGVCYLAVIAGGVFSAAVRESIFVPGDAGATMEAIARESALWRWSIAVHLVYLLAAATVGVILYRFFRDVQRVLALLALALTISDVALESLLMTALYVPTMLLSESSVFAALGAEQRAAIGYLAVRVFFRGWSFALFLFGGFCVLTGTLIIRSRLIPALIGVMMIAAGACYLTSTLSHLLAPQFAGLLTPWILIPPFIGELSFAIWLTAAGIPGGVSAPAAEVGARSPPQALST